MRDMTSLLPIICSAQLMKTIAQNVEPIKFATRKMASVGAPGDILQILGLCCFLDTRSTRRQTTAQMAAEAGCEGAAKCAHTTTGRPGLNVTN
jgi:hypothetical protein